MSGEEKKQHIIDVCLETFMEKGLSHTSTRDLCKALNLNTGGIFWYFKTKDDIIIACAEEAALRIERDLMGVALDDIDDPSKLASDLHERALEMRSLMKFFVSVCALTKYDDALGEALHKISKRYKSYCEQFSKKLCCPIERVAPYVYIVINTMLSFMLFGKSSFVAPQLELVYNELLKMVEERDRGRALNNNEGENS